MSAGSNDSELMVNRDLERLAPEFAQAVSKAIAACQAANLDAMVYEGLRSRALWPGVAAPGFTLQRA